MSEEQIDKLIDEIDNDVSMNDIRHIFNAHFKKICESEKTRSISFENIMIVLAAFNDMLDKCVKDKYKYLRELEMLIKGD